MQDFRSRRHKKNFSYLVSRLKNLFAIQRQSFGGRSKILLWSTLARYAFFGLIGAIFLTVILFFWYSRDLPTPGKLVNNDLSQSTRIYDRNGILLYSVYKTQNRAYVQLQDIPKNLQNATIAIEDRNFYNNQGFSISGYLRAIRDMILLRGLSGGSTLTQQLVRNVLLQDFQQTIPRKIKELILSIQVDKIYSKDQILEMYLNDVSYGGTNTGVETAAESYFGKHVKDLDLAQSAMLAGLPQGPSIYYPFNGNKYYIARSKEVLDAMVASGDITQKQDDNAYKEIQGFTFSSQQDASIKAPWFVMYVKQLAAQQFGDNAVENGGLQIYTTLDYNIEKYAEDVLQKEVKADTKVDNIHNAAAVVRDPKTGEILAMVGNVDYFDNASDGQYNDATASRQPGSSLKPILYATAFEKGYTAGSMVMDAQTDFPTGDPTKPMYSPVNYNGKFNGPVQLRFALGNSLNIPAVKMLARVGIKDFMTNAYNMGISNWQPTDQNISSVGLSLVLGGRETNLLDETTAYGVFATGGIKHDPVFIKKVTDSKGNTVYNAPSTQGVRVMPEDITFLISHILSDNNARLLDFGPYSSLVVPGKTVSVKTGTTDSFKDNWTVGYNTSYVVGVWVGNNDGQPMSHVASGITGAAPIWNKIISNLLKGKPDDTWLQHPPSDVEAIQIDSIFGGLPYPGQPTRSEYFIKATEPTGPSPVYQSKDGKTYFVIKEDDPVSTDGQNRWQAGIDAWIKANHSAADYQWYPPSDLSGQNNNATPTTPTPTATVTPTLSNTPTPSPTSILPTI